MSRGMSFVAPVSAPGRALGSALGLCIALVVGAAGPARADGLWERSGLADEPAGADEPEAAVEAAREAEYRRYLDKGDELAKRAMESKAFRGTSRRRSRRWNYSATLALRAVDAYERALGVRPGEPEPHYRAAEVLSRHFLSLPTVERGDPVLRDRKHADRALEHWRAFEEIAPLDPRATDTLFDRALVYTRLATEDDFHQAIVCYETLLERTGSSGGLRDYGTYYGNLAETYMMAGRLGDAIATYERALEYGNNPVHGYGLAVALDRDGQNERAREVMLTYAMADRLRDLVRDSVFFVPRGERDYYLALGYEALGDPVRALRHYQKFVDSGAHPRYQERATAHIERLRASLPRRPRGSQDPLENLVP